MLKQYRRHLNSCKHAAAGQRHWRCKCPVWERGFIDGQFVRRSTGLTDWDAATESAQRREKTGGSPPVSTKNLALPVSARTLDSAWEDFLTRKTKNQKLADSTLYKYGTLRREMQEYADSHNLRFLQDFKLDHLEIFQSTWKDGPLSSRKKLERLKAFFNSACKWDWIKDNPATDMVPPKFNRKPTQPFTSDEMERILRAVDQYQDKSGRIGQANAQRLKCFVLLLRYSGLRIGDAVSSKTVHIQGNSVCRVTQKTGEQIKCRLPEELIEILKTVPRLSNTYFFWTGKSTLHTAVGSWQRTLRKLFILAGVEGGHAHRFRDTFAVECLESGMTLLRVSRLLGHANVRVTEKHYNPWVESRQAGLDADVERSWIGDKILLSLKTGTYVVREETNENANRLITEGKELVPVVGLEPTA